MPVPNGYWYEVLNSATGGSYSRVAGNLSALVSGNN
jgi:hypothetical protein